MYQSSIRIGSVPSVVETYIPPSPQQQLGSKHDYVSYHNLRLASWGTFSTKVIFQTNICFSYAFLLRQLHHPRHRMASFNPPFFTKFMALLRTKKRGLNPRIGLFLRCIAFLLVVLVIGVERSGLKHTANWE
jgi:hypothetical protein